MPQSPNVLHFGSSVFFVLLMIGGIGLAAAHAHPTAAQGYTPRFESADCPTAELERYRADPNYDVECGFLIVPEDRSQPDGPVVRLPVALFKTLNPNPAPDPVIYLAGGGGNNHLESVGYYIEQIGDAILESRDFIHYNQRGARYSEPELNCPGHTELLWELAGQDLSQGEANAREVAFLADCQNDLIDQDINLEMYNSATNAADAHDLRIALGYEQANFYGTSYGTKLALTLMRDYPDGVRSVIIDSVYPPQVGYYSTYAPNAYRTLRLLFESCAADDHCSTQYPTLENTFFQIVDRLNTEPVRRTIQGRTVLLDGGLFMEAIDLLLYSDAALQHAPQVIYDANNGHYAPLDGMITGLLDIPDSINWAMFYAMQCREEVPFESYETTRALAADLPPQFGGFWVVRFPALAFSLCESSPVEPADSIENEPVTSDIPTLVLAGEYDPITPPAWSRSAAETLSRSFFFEFPGLSHGVMRANACGLEIGLAFFDDPMTEPDSSCMEQLTGLDFR